MNDDFTAELTAHEYSEYMAEQLAIAKAVDKALEEYKQELMDFLDNEIDSKEHWLTTGYGDHWDAGMIYAYQLTKEFIQQS